jgi:hypothetical protein
MIIFQTLSDAVGAWSHRNFGDKQSPFLGMVEELGEAAHCDLKRIQGIRGYDEPEFFRREYSDALGDICIYAANYAYNEKISVKWPIQYPDGNIHSIENYISSAMFWLSKLNGVPEAPTDLSKYLYNFLVCITGLARLEDLILTEVAESTWNEVSVRDWKVYSHNGTTD